MCNWLVIRLEYLFHYPLLVSLSVSLYQTNDVWPRQRIVDITICTTYVLSHDEVWCCLLKVLASPRPDLYSQDQYRYMYVRTL